MSLMSALKRREEERKGCGEERKEGSQMAEAENEG